MGPNSIDALAASPFPSARLGEEDQKNSLQLLHRAIDSSSCGITIADARHPDQPLIYVNSTFERLTGYSVNEVLGKNCRFLQGRKDQQAVSQQAALVTLRTSLQEGKTCCVVLRNYRKEGTAFWNELLISPVRDAEGLLTHFIGVQTDITVRKEAQDALQNSHNILEEKVNERTAELRQAYEATFENWLKVMDLRERETDGHTQRVTQMALRLASALGVDASERVHIRRGALLQAIGQTGVPDALLHKAGTLTEEERAQMQRHTEQSFQWLLPIKYLRPALAIPYSCHERWDGTGYPRGLTGEEIPLPARLFSVVDLWDTLISERPGRSAWPEAQAMDHIRSLAGTQFDPRIVTVFLQGISAKQLTM